MKSKAILAMSLAIVLTASAMVGCKKNTGDTGSSGTSSNVSSQAPTQAEGGLLKDIHAKVKEAYGEDYIPSMAFDDAYMEEQLGITKDMYEEFIAEGPMISTHVDTFVGVEAKEGKAEEVEKKLNDYRQKLVDDTMQYPMNVPKINASKVVREGNYVFFTLLGAIDDTIEDEAGMLKHFEAETKKATDAIEGILKK